MERAGVQGEPGSRGKSWLESVLLFDQLGGFERELLDPSSPIHRGGRDALLRAAIDEAMSAPSRSWSAANRVFRSWLPLEGLDSIPSTRALGWLLGGQSMALPGSTHSPRQGRVVRASGRRIGIGPVWRMVCDLGDPGVRTMLWGGPTDGPLDPRAHRDLFRWKRDEWKMLGWKDNP